VQPLTAREQQRLESWRALQAAALALVDRRGFAAVTVDDIAAAAGVARRTFFNHFPTKAAALFDPDPDDARRLAQLLAEADGTSELWATLRRVCVSFVAGHENVIAVRRRLIAESPELDQYHRAAHRHVELALDRWARRQRPGDPFTATLIAHTASAVFTSSFATWQPDDEPQLLVDLVDRGFVLLAHGFAG
jgi:AcrR family transcriptional regulator